MVCKGRAIEVCSPFPMICFKDIYVVFVLKKQRKRYTHSLIYSVTKMNFTSPSIPSEIPEKFL